MLLHHRARHARQNGRLTATTLLVVVLEPVPAARRVGALRLRRVEHKKALFQRRLVHAGPGGEIVGVLRAAMQHDDQGQGARGRRRGDVELVIARGRAFTVAAGDELAVRPRGLRGRCGLHGSGCFAPDLACLHVNHVEVAVRSCSRRCRSACGSGEAVSGQRRLDGCGRCLQVAALSQACGFGKQALKNGVHGVPWWVFSEYGRPAPLSRPGWRAARPAP